MARPNIEKVPFNGDIVRAGQLDGVTHVVCKDVCENIGVDWHNQRKTLASSEFYRKYLTTARVDPGQCELSVLPVKYARLWIASINENLAAEHVKPRLLEYKEACCDAIEAYFNNAVDNPMVLLAKALNNQTAMTQTMLQQGTANTQLILQKLDQQKSPETVYVPGWSVMGRCRHLKLPFELIGATPSKAL